MSERDFVNKGDHEKFVKIIAGLVSEQLLQKRVNSDLYSSVTLTEKHRASIDLSESDHAREFVFDAEERLKKTRIKAVRKIAEKYGFQIAELAETAYPYRHIKFQGKGKMVSLRFGDDGKVLSQLTEIVDMIERGYDLVIIYIEDKQKLKQIQHIITSSVSEKIASKIQCGELSSIAGFFDSLTSIGKCHTEVYNGRVVRIEVAPLSRMEEQKIHGKILYIMARAAKRA